VKKELEEEEEEEGGGGGCLSHRERGNQAIYLCHH